MADETIDTNSDTTQTNRVTYMHYCGISKEATCPSAACAIATPKRSRRKEGEYTSGVVSGAKKNIDCLATMSQLGETFEPRRDDHKHPPEQGATLNAQVSVNIWRVNRVKAKMRPAEP
ncbi:Hypp2871 [Branchiostoma lanceolatum]|uniref:Hypp2871 protein n=1 Tax=Branchiostoma lanceolatum TaxID=7740 RepID=A0A8K0EPS0_BRALA|nr:Hypp2871 [Branchiostoma lanceolatum]